MRKRIVRAAAVVVWLSFPAPLVAQTGLTGGPQPIVWPSDCDTNVRLRNDTGLVMVGLWIGIGNDGVNNPPEVATLWIDASANRKVFSNERLRIWDTDDNEDLDDEGDGGEDDKRDSTPGSLASGWHRVQSRGNLQNVGLGEVFSLRLCDELGGSLAGRTLYLLPMAPREGQLGGDLSRRAEVPFGVRQSAPVGSVSIDSAGAPPDSTSFSVQITNTDPTLRLRELEITPPPGVTVVDASASGGGTYDPPNSIIIWSTPLPPNGTAQINVELSSLARVLSPTTIQFTGTDFVVLASVPAQPGWAIGVLFGAFAAVAAFVLSRRSG